MKILILNAGSTSLKFKLYDMERDAVVLGEGNCQRVGLETGDIKYIGKNGKKEVLELPLPNHTDALRKALELMTQGENRILATVSEIGAVGHRVSMGGPNYVKSVRLSDDVIDAIDELKEVTPLHTPPQVSTIRACRELLGKDFPMAVGFDTAFHQTMPPASYIYPVPYEWYEKHNLRRFGFHGLSHQFIVERFSEILGRGLEGTRIVTCHLGGGSSLTAVQDGKSRDNTFGFGSGQGPMCGSRCGTFDHSAVQYLMNKEKLTYDELEDMLNRKSGLLGISGISSDEKTVEDAALAGNERANLTLDVMFHQIKKYIGAYAFEMGGIDALLFTGGIGENSDYVRGKVCEGLEPFGIKLDKTANVEHNRTEHRISSSDSNVDIWIIPTNEELVIARDTYSIIFGE